ncbi:Mannitol 2-dehydrogenase [Starkeya nomas]|uniref:Mannitol 2-dehydrogenase n=1 Tax=Starkeya nomas TaxID=2666134 RepID=A0A5S9Q5G2_9HYPH|nr:mannitol dehydrogenase family protein [Starkeya nomas]CAA0112436.1 Mannitol 2-dehydrogenase [Starkeya nomas]
MNSLPRLSVPRLSAASLGRLAPGIAAPAYDRAGQSVGIVHLGIGAFHRAHQAVFVDDRMAAGERDWAILGASLRSPEMRDALAPQDGLYTLVERDEEGERARIVGSVSRLLVAPEAPAALLEAMSAPQVRIVSLTVTEKGYCHDPATGELREDHPDILHDLATPDLPRSAPGFLVEALARRRATGIPPFTVLCCDNLPANGRLVRRIASRLAGLRDAGLGHFVENEVAFPCTMVDRIVPATTHADRDAVDARLGLTDAWPVVTEPFRQWVIEDDFNGGRPRFEEAGAELVADAAPYETMKLRLLNGSHSSLAYLGYLAGHETVAEAIAAPGFETFIRGLMDREVTPTLRVPAQTDLAAYKAALLRRFANPALHHRTWQIAMDGSQKIPQRLLATIRARLADGAPIARLALALAAWMRFVSGIDEQGRSIDVRDPLAARLRALADAAGPLPDALVPSLLGVREIFDTDLAADPRLVGAVLEALSTLYRVGAGRAVAQFEFKPEAGR